MCDIPVQLGMQIFGKQFNAHSNPEKSYTKTFVTNFAITYLHIIWGRMNPAKNSAIHTYEDVYPHEYVMKELNIIHISSFCSKKGIKIERAQTLRISILIRGHVARIYLSEIHHRRMLEKFPYGQRKFVKFCHSKRIWVPISPTCPLQESFVCGEACLDGWPLVM